MSRQFSQRYMDSIEKLQREKQQWFRNTPDEGKFIDYLGKKFIVFPSVFFPTDDSIPLVENYHINSGERVLDVCTGSGVIAVHSALKGARQVVALDINPQAVRAAKANALIHNVYDRMKVYRSDVFDDLKEGERFDVITGNLPFRNRKAGDYAEATMFDSELMAHRKLFDGLDRHLANRGRVYLAHANFGAIDDMKRLARENGFSCEKIGTRKVLNPLRVFYAFELRRKN